MKCKQTDFEEVKLITPQVFDDDRGSFSETFNLDIFCEHIGSIVSFVQDNQSVSSRGVLRGMHYQIEHPQGKLVRVSRGEVFDVAVDMRRTSPSFGSWVGATLSEENRSQLWIPSGFAHGFLALTNNATVQYKVTDFWHPEHERTLVWNDPTVNISWPTITAGDPTLSCKDAEGVLLNDAECFE